MSAAASADTDSGTDFGRALLEEATDQKPGEPDSAPSRPARTFAERVREAVETGADLDRVMRHFNLTREELRDICPDAIEGDDAWDTARQGFGDGGY